MNALQKIQMGLLLAKIKLGGVYTRDWEKDPNPENWRTINGSHVHLVNGKIDGGAGGKFKGNNWTGQKAHGSNSFFPRFNYQQNLFGGQEVMPSRTVQKEQNRQKRIERRAQRRNERHEANKAAGLARQKELASMSIPQLQQQQKEAFLNPSMSTSQAMEEKRALNKIIKRREKADPNLNKNHPYWSTPEGKAQAKADKWFDTLDDPNSSRQTQPREKIIQTQYEAARKKMLSLNSAVAGANNEIDQINRKRGELTEADISRKRQLRKQARQLEMEANAFARRFEQWKKKYNPKEETGIKERIDLGKQENEQKTYSALEAVAELRRRAKARKMAAEPKSEKPKATTPRKKGTMKSRLWDNAKEAGIDLDAFHVGGGKWDKRNNVHIDIEKMPKEQQAAFTQMVKEKGYTMSWNGGLGYVIKEPAASTKARAYKPTEKTAAPEGYEEYLKRKNSGELNSYEEQQEARRERFEGRSAAATAESRQRSQAARNIMSMIPAGQPILVGHHSERRHRSDLNKVDTNMRKSWEASKKADYYAQRAESVGTGGISSVDPDAVFKVYEKLHDLEVLQDKMKEANASGTKQYPSYALVNNSSEIRRLKKRLEDLSKAASTEGQSIESNTLYDLKQEEGRYQFKFDGKPSDEVRSILKHNGFKWSPSRGTWVRSAAGSGKYAMERVKKELEPHIVIPF